MRLIDADDLKNLPFERMIHTDFGETAIPIEEIDNAPTVPYPDFKEGYKQAIRDGKTNFSRPQGEWLHPYISDIACECSNCHIQMPITDYFNFCPNCGTQMKGGAE